MSITEILFYAFSGVLLVSAVGVITARNPVHAALFLVFSFFNSAVLWMLLEAEFLAAVQLLLYAGGIVTIVVFAIVVTERLVGERITQTSRRITAGGVTALALIALVVNAISRQPLPTAREPLTTDLTRTIGESVLTRFVLPFELLGVLMLAAMLGAVYFARPED